MTRRLGKWIGVGVFVWLAVMADAKPASAQSGCFVSLQNCFYRAARGDRFLNRTLTALDCELDFIECIRRKVGGW